MPSFCCGRLLVYRDGGSYFVAPGAESSVEAGVLTAVCPSCKTGHRVDISGLSPMT